MFPCKTENVQIELITAIKAVDFMNQIKVWYSAHPKSLIADLSIIRSDGVHQAFISFYEA